MCFSCTPMFDEDGNEIDPLVYAMTLGAGVDQEEARRDYDELMANAAEMFSFLKEKYGPGSDPVL